MITAKIHYKQGPTRALSLGRLTVRCDGGVECVYWFSPERGCPGHIAWLLGLEAIRWQIRGAAA